MTGPQWEELEGQLLELVFYAHDPEKVRNSMNLADDGMLDSLSVVAILDVLAEAHPEADLDSLENLGPADFRNLSAIRTLHERL